MKTERSSHRINTRFIALALAACCAASVSAQVTHIYCARVSSDSDTRWDAPFWWMGTPGSAYSTSTGKSAAPGVPASRKGSYFHTLWAQPLGDGFGLVCTACSSAPGSVYEVSVTQPSYNVAADTIFGVCSTNCTIGGLSGGGGYATNTTAFQAANSANQWGFVCWLTNTLGVANPEIEFHYVSGTDPDNQLRNYADCVRFVEVCCSSGPLPVRITAIGGASVAYSGGAGTRFILLKSVSLGAAPGSWQRLGTNYVTPGLFDVPGMGGGASAFYRIQSE